MLAIRLIAVLTILLVVAGVGAYFVTGNRRYLRFAWTVFVIAALLAMLVFALLALERLAIIPLPV